jgi:hypothetical protein
MTPSWIETATSTPHPECMRAPMAACFIMRVTNLKIGHYRVCCGEV